VPYSAFRLTGHAAGPATPQGRHAAHREPRAVGKLREGDAGGFGPGPGRNRV